jgi:hypothetical protein
MLFTEVLTGITTQMLGHAVNSERSSVEWTVRKMPRRGDGTTEELTRRNRITG